MTMATNTGGKGAAVPATINALINGAIAYSGHRTRDAVPITVDAISSSEATVGSEAAMIALTLAVILTCITAVITRKSLQASRPDAVHPPFLPTVARLALQNALTMFGATVAAAVLWQRLVGTVMVSPGFAPVLVGLFAAAATAFVHGRTIRTLERTPA
jgi:hypothetical protein